TAAVAVTPQVRDSGTRRRVGERFELDQILVASGDLANAGEAFIGHDDPGGSHRAVSVLPVSASYSPGSSPAPARSRWAHRGCTATATRAAPARARGVRRPRRVG